MIKIKKVLKEAKDRIDTGFWYVKMMKSGQEDVKVDRIDGIITPGLTSNRWIRFEGRDRRGNGFVFSVHRMVLEDMLKHQETPERYPEGDEEARKYRQG